MHRGGNSRLTGRTLFDRIGVGTLSLFALLISVLLYSRFAAPERLFERFVPFEEYRTEPMQEAMGVDRVDREHRAILALGSRFAGQPGYYRSADYIRDAFDRAGLEIYEQEFQTVAPQTAYREIYRVLEESAARAARVEPLEGVTIYPFMPNYLQPVVTPPEGITGELVLLDQETLNTRRDFDGCIGLIDSREEAVPREYGFDWTRYANLGMEALLVSHSQGLEEAPWVDFSPGRGRWAMVSSVPINYVRLAASKGIFRYIGETIRLRVRVDYRRVDNVNLFGVLRAPKTSAEAILITFPYDAPSILPDLAPGVLPALASVVPLRLLDGLLQYEGSRRRDIIFAGLGSSALAEGGHNNLLRVIGKKNQDFQPERLLQLGKFDPARNRLVGTTMDAGDQRQVYLEERWEENERQRYRVGKVLELFEVEGFAADSDTTRKVLNGLDESVRDLVKEQFAYVVKTRAFELGAPLLEAKIELERKRASGIADSEALRNYLKTKQKYDEAHSASGYRMTHLLKTKGERAKRYGLRARLWERIKKLQGHHERRRRELEQDTEVLNLFNRYARIGLFSTRLAPAPPESSPGTEVVSSGSGAAYIQSTITTIIRLMNRAKRRLELGDALELPAPGEWQDRTVSRHIGHYVSRQAPRIWGNIGYPTFFIYSFERKKSYSHYAYPVDLPFMHDLDTLSNTLLVIGESMISLAHGNGSLEATQIWHGHQGRDFSGRVLAAQVGPSMVPNYPVKDALVACRSRPDSNMWAYPGYYRHPILMSDVYGRYEASRNFNDFPVFSNVGRDGGTIAPLAAKIGADGLISHIKDEGDAIQRTFKSTKVPWWRAQDLTLVLFPGSPMTLLDLTNPQTLKEYTGVKMIRSDGLVAPDRFCLFESTGLVATFLEPDQRCYVELQSGAQEHQRAKVTRAFMTNVDASPEGDLNREIDGRGYLVSDHPYLRDLPSEVAHSMAYVNGRRLELQNYYGMADKRINDYHNKVLTHLDGSQEASLSKKMSIREARQAVTYATLNHPELRKSIMEAVVGILWYLALLVPFIFFFEKLLFCFSDVRKQIAAQMVIFVTVFALLRLLHPAFSMVRSSLMILLGFVIILISISITVLFSEKAHENFRELLKRRGRARTAEVDKLGVMSSAFMLGLNNMHRRKVRTGLTCATLSLITFVIICFTSVQDDLVEENIAVGVAPYQGLLLKQEQMAPFHSGEIQAIHEKYGDRFEVCPRYMRIGYEDFRDRSRKNPDLTISRQGEGRLRKIEFESVIRMKHNEPMRNRIRFLTDNEWFTENDEIETGGLIPVFIPDTMAERLSIFVNQVNKEPVTVWINGEQCAVRGIFDSDAYDAMTDLDGYRLLPFDVTAIEVLTTKGWGTGVVANEDDPKIPPHGVILAPYSDHRFTINQGTGRVISVAIAMPDAGNKEVRQVVASFVEQTARPVSYGLDGIAYWARRTREGGLGDLFDLAVPLAIAAFTVLNTMRGSVYERRDEIYVYNSLGIAPRHVFFMFLSEALVYAVVGSILGYTLSQGTGRILTALDMTGGFNMSFTSLSTVYASLTLFAAVLISTYFPARSAMQIAAPAEDAGWDLPEPEGDYLRFHLPFTFNFRGRIGVLAFFDRMLLDHGEGGTGRFFSEIPEYFVDPERNPPGDLSYVPSINATIWLKPFDLGVSQRLAIAMPPDEESREYITRIEIQHLSGTQDSWLRLNRGFIAQIRQHFLHWRALSLVEREELFSESRDRLAAAMVNVASGLNEAAESDRT